MSNNQQNLPSTQTHSRNYGIDLLRIVSMIMIPLLHILGHGGVLESTTPLTVQNESLWLIETAAYCAVDVYALISGYVSYGRRHKYSNIIYLTFQVMFYTVITTTAFYFYRPELVNMKTILGAVFPFAFGTYWYFTAYFCLFFLIPFLNLAIEKFDKATMQKLILSCLLVFSVLPTLFQNDFPLLNRGNSFLWLAVLYVVGAYIKKYGNSFKYKNQRNLYSYLIIVAITWLSKIVIELLTSKVLGEPKGGKYLIGYNSPLIVMCAVFLLIYFSNIKCGKGLIKFISFFAPVSFGVYLLHEEPLIKETLITGAFVRYLSFNPIITVLSVIGTAICIWLLGSLIDRIRLEIFNLLKIKQLSEWLEQKVKKALSIINLRLSRKADLN